MSFLTFFKYVLFIYNFAVMLFGGALLGLAIYFYVETLHYIEGSARTWPIYSTFFIVIIGIGLLTLIIGFFGCCGATKESSCMLCLYFTIIVAICGLVGAAIFMPDKIGEIKPERIKLGLQLDIKEIIQKSYTRQNTSNFPNLLIDEIQEDFQCCGSLNYSDWYSSLLNNATRPDIGVGSGGYSFMVASPSNQRALAPQSQQQTYYNSKQQQYNPPPTVTSSIRVPISCCSKYNENSYNQCKAMIARSDESQDQSVLRIPNVNQEGCVEKIYHYLFVSNWWKLNIIGGLAIGLQGLSLIFSFCLCCAINRAIDDDYDDEEK